MEPREQLPNPPESPEAVAARIDAALLVTPDVLAAAWETWDVRHRGRLGPGPGFSEALQAALQRLLISQRIMVVPSEEELKAALGETED